MTIQREHLLTCQLGTKPDRLEAHRVLLQPGQATGLHTHPGGVTGYVENGLIAYELDGHPIRELRPGDVFFEPAGEIVRRFDNLSADAPATFIAFYLLTTGQPLIEPL
jgi:quercetin dioxygenase-like cupin family protein